MPPPGKKCWSESFGAYGATIRVAERELGGIIYLLWRDGSGKQRKRSLGHRNRDLARKQAMELASRIADNPTAAEREPKPLTIGRGIALAFNPARGMYPTQTKHTREARKLVERGACILGPELQWSELTPGKIQYLVRVLARKSKNGQGARAAEYMCDVLYGIARWLRQERLISETDALPRRGWKACLKEDWETLTGVRVAPKRPRHSIDEVTAIFGALPSADPRLRLLVGLAAELRAGQAVRAKRSDLVLGPLGGFGLGRFVVHGRGKKHGEIVDLHPELRTLVDEVLDSGYLAAAEAAYRDGRIRDYYVFPAGRLKDAQVPVARCIGHPLGSSAIRRMFRTLEKTAGVEHQPGRSLYGLRRQATDLAPEFAQDSRVLNRLTGHLDSATRERVYQDPQNEVVRARAAQARREMRQYLEQGSPPKPFR